jgi:hypothetical protein
MFGHQLGGDVHALVADGSAAAARDEQGHVLLPLAAKGTSCTDKRFTGVQAGSW